MVHVSWDGLATRLHSSVILSTGQDFFRNLKTFSATSNKAGTYFSVCFRFFCSSFKCDMGDGKPHGSTAGPFFSLFFLNGILVLLLTCIHQDTTVISQPCCSDATLQRTKIRGTFCRSALFLCKDASADAWELKRLSCVLDKVLVCLCKFGFTHRWLRARSVCLLAAAEFHPELSFPKPHQTPRRQIYDAVAVLL